MLNVELYDRQFIICGPSCGTGSTGKHPKFVHWVQSHQDIAVFTDYRMDEVYNCYNKYKILMLIESPAIVPQIYDKIYNDLNLRNQFNYILTFNKKLLDLKENFIFSPNSSGHWILDDDIKIHEKSKNLSIIASNKNITIGHLLRHSIINKFKNKIEGIYGRDKYKTIDNKIEGLKDYRFNIAIENIKQDYYFTEKITDCFLTGIVPIYYGCPSIAKFFNKKGILIFNNEKDFEILLEEKINEDYYNILLKTGIIEENFNRAKKYMYPEDYIYNKLFKKLK